MGADQTHVCKDNRENATLKNVRSIDDCSPRGLSLQRKANVANNTGLPNNLKNGVEALSGYSLDNVRVHYNSSKPAAVQAYAYTQGTDIHIAPGQESCLPHEAWHVTQQMSGRVSPTTSIGGVAVNDDASLEHEADVMGAKALQCKCLCGGCSSNLMQVKAVSSGCDVRQLKLIPSECESEFFQYSTYSSINGGFDSSVKVGTKMGAELRKGEADFNHGEKSSNNTTQDRMMADYRDRMELDQYQLVKGHLLNEHLGGRANDENLFPITRSANTKHLFYVENHVKSLVLDGRQVHYSVNASPCDGKWNTECQKAKFECHYETIDFGPKEEKNVTIYSIIDKPSKKGRGKAVDKDGRELDRTEGNYRKRMNEELRKTSNEYNLCNIGAVNDFFDDVDECIGDIVGTLGFFFDINDVESALNEIISKIEKVEELEFEILDCVFSKLGYSGYFRFLGKLNSNPGIDDIIDPTNFIQYIIFKLIEDDNQKLLPGQERDGFISKLNVEDCIDSLKSLNISGMADFLEKKLSPVKNILDKISVVIDNISCISDKVLSEKTQSETNASKNEKDVYKILGKRIAKKVIRKIIRVADTVVKMITFSKSVLDYIADPEEMETLFENVINLYLVPKELSENDKTQESLTYSELSMTPKNELSCENVKSQNYSYNPVNDVGYSSPNGDDFISAGY